MIIEVKVKPKSSKEGFLKIEERKFEVSVIEPPEKGKANKRVIEILSEHFKVPKSNIKLIKGETSKIKLFEITI
ncbi:MAG: DUF167 domain-containing protein [Brevinematia bacterium]|jgi:uncharacterized protein (TIGR00251 family)